MPTQHQLDRYERLHIPRGNPVQFSMAKVPLEVHKLPGVWDAYGCTTEIRVLDRVFHYLDMALDGLVVMDVDTGDVIVLTMQ
jgi:hypothetical protein